MPLHVNFTAIERAVMECASAGVDSIWVTVPREHLSLVRKVLGDYVYDPVFLYNFRKKKFSHDYIKRIPIFYCPMRIRDIGLKDSEPFGIINSALCAKRFASKLTKNLEPSMFYVAFHDGIYHPFVAATNRPLINTEQNFYYSFEGKSFKDGEPLGFTFSNQQLIDCHEFVRHKGTKKYRPISEFKTSGEWLELLPKEERYSATKFTVDKVFDKVIIDNANEYKLKWFYNINDWQAYRKYIGSHCTLRRPKKMLCPPNNLERM